MRVLFINSVCGIRSTGRIVAELAERYISEGCECKIAYGREASPSQYESIAYRIGNSFSIKVNALKARLLDNEAFNAKKETEMFLKWADNYNPDVLWLHNLHGYYINVELLFRWIKTRPQMEVKWTLHDCWAFTGHCPHFEFVGCDKWKTECSKCEQRGGYPRSLFLDKSQSNFRRKKAAFCGVKNLTLITPSNWLAEHVKKSFLKEYPVEVVHNRIDESIFKPTKSDFREKYELKGKIIVLGVASSWNERKGLLDFRRLAYMLNDEIVLVMVGLNQRQAKEMPEQVICIESTDSKRELAEIYSAANVFINLTYEDTYPTVNLESLACGTPCVTYRTGGSVESVASNCVVEKGDLLGILEKIKLLGGVND